MKPYISKLQQEEYEKAMLKTMWAMLAFGIVAGFFVGLIVTKLWL